LRQATAAAFNAYLAEQYAPYADRLIPVACIPTFTPEEAIRELEHAVVDLGLRAVMMGGAIRRPIPEGGPGAIWMDGLGHGSLYDYDPLWRRCVELGVSPTSIRRARGGAPVCRQTTTFSITSATLLPPAN